MKHTPYLRYLRDEFTLRDFLAIDRTVLANERTLLAYINSGLALLLTGISFIKFFTSGPVSILGGISIGSGVAVFIIGLKRFVQKQKMYAVLLEKEQAEAEATAESPWKVG